MNNARMVTCIKIYDMNRTKDIKVVPCCDTNTMNSASSNKSNRLGKYHWEHQKDTKLNIKNIRSLNKRRPNYSSLTSAPSCSSTR